MISICLIGKNEKQNLKPLHESLKPLLRLPGAEIVYVDTGSTDGTPEAAKELGWHVYLAHDLISEELARYGQHWCPEEWKEWSKHGHFEGGLLRSFAEARQRSFNLAQNDLCFWLDLDDELIGADELARIIASYQGRPNVVLFMQYDYAFDERGNCTTVLWRERVVDRRCVKWVGRCHEVLVPTAPRETLITQQLPPDRIRIKHRAPKAHRFADLRNYILLRYDLQIAGKHDPRTLFYLGNACRGLGRYDEAIHYYERFIPQSGNKEDIYVAALNLVQIYGEEKERPWAAIKWARYAQTIKPDDPRAYFAEAAAWAHLHFWDRAVMITEMWLRRPVPPTLHAVDPASLRRQPLMILMKCYRELRMPERVLQIAQQLTRTTLLNEEQQEIVQDHIQWARAEIIGLAQIRALQTAKNPELVAANLRLSPHLMYEHRVAAPDRVDLRQFDVVFWCGFSAEKWGPEIGRRGIGASEKMVVYMAEELAKLGLKVAVYCDLQYEVQPGSWVRGVYWSHTAKFPYNSEIKNLVIWRAPQVIGAVPFKAQRIYVWMHDVGSNDVWTPDRVRQIEKVMFLSRYHRSLHPRLPDEKVWLTRNGIRLDEFKPAERREKRLVYCSSPDRGWKRAIHLFHYAGLHDYGYELHLFYDFGETFRALASTQEYGRISEEGRERRLIEYEDECKELADRVPGVVRRGRVGWREMIDIMCSSRALLYPTQFEEISCVVAMEAQAAGLWVFATPFAALNETLAGYDGWVEIPFDDVATAARKIKNKLLKAKTQPKPRGEPFDIRTLAQEWKKVWMSE